MRDLFRLYTALPLSEWGAGAAFLVFCWALARQLARLLAVLP